MSKVKNPLSPERWDYLKILKVQPRLFWDSNRNGTYVNKTLDKELKRMARKAGYTHKQLRRNLRSQSASDRRMQKGENK